MNFLRPISNKYLIRAGINKDGGYVVDSNLFENTECLLSFGLGDDWSFEEDFLKKNKKKGVVNIYDHTINIYVFLETVYQTAFEPPPPPLLSTPIKIKKT